MDSDELTPAEQWLADTLAELEGSASPGPMTPARFRAWLHQHLPEGIPTDANWDHPAFAHLAEVLERYLPEDDGFGKFRAGGGITDPGLIFTKRPAK